MKIRMRLVLRMCAIFFILVVRNKILAKPSIALQKSIDSHKTNFPHSNWPYKHIEQTENELTTFANRYVKAVKQSSVPDKAELCSSIMNALHELTADLCRIIEGNDKEGHKSSIEESILAAKSKIVINALKAKASFTIPTLSEITVNHDSKTFRIRNTESVIANLSEDHIWQHLNMVAREDFEKQRKFMIEVVFPSDKFSTNGEREFRLRQVQSVDFKDAFKRWESDFHAGISSLKNKQSIGRKDYVHEVTSAFMHLWEPFGQSLFVKFDEVSSFNQHFFLLVFD